MTTIPVKFFVGRFKNKAGEVYFRVLRQRKVGRIVPRIVVEGFADAWTPVKAKFARASNLFVSREAARREKYALEGRA